ncbi:MAG: sulfatase-like hydrolase/transferase [Gammaproteobacteria bacterium]|nr:sulfatase-like hydrolase/transferase [Gammaproteobacteria bacterium]
MSTPNCLIIMSDEHQATINGYSGHPVVQTPNLDALAASGMQFSNAYTPSPICIPARAAFATGDYVHNIHHWDNAMPYAGEIRGWGHCLQDAAIPVESIGKLHYRKDEDPAGFDVEHIPMNAHDGVGMVWGSIRNPPQLKENHARMLGDYIGPGTSKYTEYDEAITLRTIDWFEERRKSGDHRPWCLYVGLVAPHFPLIAPQGFFDLYPLDTLPPAKLHPRDGYISHPWAQAQADFMDCENQFVNEEERLRAFAAYFGLVSFLDHNVGQILAGLQNSGFADNTRVFYTSDHGDNLGARGMWGKSNMYEESVAIPLVASGPGINTGVCKTPVSLIDFAPTILENFGVIDTDIAVRPGVSMLHTMSQPYDETKVTFSEYHAVGSATGAYMIRKGRWKYNYYIGHQPELFDLQSDPEEMTNLANDPSFARILLDLHQELTAICNPQAADAHAHADQEAMIERYGGKEAAAKLGAPGATPAPEGKQ